MRVVWKVKTINNFPIISRAAPIQVGNALHNVAEEIMTDSKANYVPVITGNLKGSGFVKKAEITPHSTTVTLGYGGAAANYALLVHEYPKWMGQHKNKYLTKPLNAALPNVGKRIAEFLQMMKVK